MHIIAHAPDISVWYANGTNCNKIWYITASSDTRRGALVFILLGAAFMAVLVLVSKLYF